MDDDYKVFGLTLVQPKLLRTHLRLASFSYEDDEMTICIGEDEGGEWYGFMHLGESEINAWAESAKEVCAELESEANRVRGILSRLG
jgi:hypothetical protein